MGIPIVFKDTLSMEIVLITRLPILGEIVLTILEVREVFIGGDYLGITCYHRSILRNRYVGVEKQRN